MDIERNKDKMAVYFYEEVDDALLRFAVIIERQRGNMYFASIN